MKKRAPFYTEYSDIFYIVVVVVVTLLALAVLCLIEMTESRVSIVYLGVLLLNQ